MIDAAAEVGGFLLRVGVVYALLALPGNPLEGCYAVGYRATVNQIAAALPLEHHVWLRESALVEANRDSSFVARHRVSGNAAERSFSVRYFSWIGTCVVAALVLATPVAWRRRAWGAVGGLLVYHGYLGLQISAYLLLTFGGSRYHGGWRPALDVFALTPWYVAPVLCWWLCVGLRLVQDRLRERQRDRAAGAVLGGRTLPPLAGPGGEDG